MAVSRWLGGVLLACSLLLTAACSAHDDSHATAGAADAATTPAGATVPATAAPASAASTHFVEGEDYVKLKLPEGQAAPTGPVEVVEVFSYGCPHCARFAPYMDQLRAGLPPGTEVRYMPAVFSAAWMPDAQAFYAARQLGVLEQTHDALFKAMLEHYPLNSLEDLAAWYARHGVDRQKFLAAATSAETMKQMADDQHLEIRWGIDGTPALVVGRRASDAGDAPFVALLRSAHFDNYDELRQLGLWMARHVEQP